jgi:hypothetical protein
MHKNVIWKTNGKRTAPIRISAQRVWVVSAMWVHKISIAEFCIILGSLPRCEWEDSKNTKNHNKALPNPKRHIEVYIEDGGCGGILHPEIYGWSAHHTSILRSNQPAATTGVGSVHFTHERESASKP